MSKRKSETPFLDAKVRFWSKVSTASPNECWEYKGDKDDFGYGRVTVAGKKYRTHRFSYALHHYLTMDGIKDVVIRHTCDNPSCVNPNHLLPGTFADNNKDTRDRGRSNLPPGSFKSKLKAHQVKAIRDAFITHSLNQTQLAEAYGVSLATINDIILRRTWKNLPD